MKNPGNILLKVCGLRDPKNIHDISEVFPDFMGFIFYPKSPRYVVGELDPEVLKAIPASVKKVGVFVNEDLERALELANEYHLDMLQLHGSESPEYCEKCRARMPVIKAFAMSDSFEVSEIEKYRGNVDYFLFDTKTEKYGGSGCKFDWGMLKKLDLKAPYFLSGGIGPEDIDDVVNAGLPEGFILDVNSKVEVSPGLKDLEKVRQIRAKIKKSVGVS